MFRLSLILSSSRSSYLWWLKGFSVLQKNQSCKHIWWQRFRIVWWAQSGSWCWISVLRMAQARYASRTMSHHTPQPDLYALLQPNDSVLPHYKGDPATAKSWLFAVQALQWWNELPTDIRTAETLHNRLNARLFRLHLKYIIASKCST